MGRPKRVETDLVGRWIPVAEIFVANKGTDMPILLNIQDRLTSEGFEVEIVRRDKKFMLYRRITQSDINVGNRKPTSHHTWIINLVACSMDKLPEELIPEEWTV